MKISRTIRMAVLSVLATALTVGAVAGQEPGPDGQGTVAPRLLTLHEALDIAVRGNPSYLQATNQLNLAGPQRQQVWGQFLPSVSLNLSTDQGFVRQTIGTDDFGRPIPNPDAGTTYTSGSAQGLSFNWTVFDGLRRFQGLKEQEAQVVAWQGSADARLAQLTADVERAFFEAQLRRDLVAVEEEVLRVRQRALEATERLFALADKSRADVLGARVELQRQEATVAATTRDYRKTLLELQQQMGESSLGAFEVADAPLDVFDPASLDVGQLVGMAGSGSPEIRRDEATLALNRAQAKQARGTRWPTLNLSGNVGRNEFGPDQSALFDLSPSARAGGGVSLSLGWEIFDRFDRQYTIASADVSTRDAAEGLRETGLLVEQAVRAGYIDLETAYGNLAIGLVAEEQAQERLRLVGEEYLLAITDFVTLQDVVSQAADAARDVVTARFNFIDARITLEQAIGARITTVPASPDGTD